MSHDYSENILVQESAGNLLQNELGWDVKYAYNTEVLGETGTFAGGLIVKQRIRQNKLRKLKKGQGFQPLVEWS